MIKLLSTVSLLVSQVLGSDFPHTDQQQPDTQPQSNTVIVDNQGNSKQLQEFYKFTHLPDDVIAHFLKYVSFKDIFSLDIAFTNHFLRNIWLCGLNKLLINVPFPITMISSYKNPYINYIEKTVTWTKNRKIGKCAYSIKFDDFTDEMLDEIIEGENFASIEEQVHSIKIVTMPHDSTDIDLLLNKTKNLLELDIEWAEPYSELVSINFPSTLKTLKLIGVPFEDDIDRVGMISHCKNLEHLSISALENISITQLLNTLPNLKILKIYNCDISLEPNVNLNENKSLLHTLDIERSYLNENNLCQITKSCPCLSNLTLKYSTIDGDDFNLFCLSKPNLKTLTIWESDGSDGLEPTNYSHIVYLNQLISISIKSNKVCRCFLTMISQNLKKLKKLSFTYGDKIMANSFKHLDLLSDSLEEMRLEYTNIDDDSLTYLLINLKKLTHLSVKYSIRITEGNCSFNMCRKKLSVNGINLLKYGIAFPEEEIKYY